MPRRTNYRSSGTRSETPLLFVMGDGISEKLYFENLNLMVKKMRIKPHELGESGWESILKKCDGFVKHGDVDLRHGDRLAIVTDDDDKYDTESLTAFQRECRRKGYELFLSNRSFEVWLLLHYESFTKPYSQNELENKISKHIGHRYCKSEGIAFDKAMVYRAIENSEKNLPSGDDMECLNKNPSSTLHTLVTSILDN